MKSDERYEIRFSGSGGQGIITAAVVMADGVGAFDNKYVCQTQSYGPEARGGKSKAEVVISDSPIDYPKALQVDLLLAMNQDHSFRLVLNKWQGYYFVRISISAIHLFLTYCQR